VGHLGFGEGEAVARTHAHDGAGSEETESGPVEGGEGDRVDVGPVPVQTGGQGTGEDRSAGWRSRSGSWPRWASFRPAAVKAQSSAGRTRSATPGSRDHGIYQDIRH
jgi:hypothetical protein